MNKFIVLAAVVAVVAGEAPPHVGLGGYSGGGGRSGGGSIGGGRSGGSSGGGSGLNEYVDEALLARVGELIARGGDGSGTQQGTEGLRLDSEILTRVSGSLGDGGASSGPSTSYGPPSSSGQAMLGNPEPAQRIAEFELSDGGDGGASQGGYQQAPPPQQAPSSEYGAPISRGPSRGGSSGGSSGGGSISLGRPEPAQRVDDFSVSGGAGPSRQSSGGYN